MLRYIITFLIFFTLSFSSWLLFLTLCTFRVSFSSSASMPPLLVDLSVVGQRLLMLTKFRTLSTKEALGVGAFAIHMILICL